MTKIAGITLSALVVSIVLNANAGGGLSCPEISGLYEKTTVRSGGREIKSLLSIHQNGCDDVLIMERLYKKYEEDFSGTKWPEWQSQWTLLTYTPQVFSSSIFNSIEPFVLEDGWVRESADPRAIWSLRKFNQDALVCGLYDGSQKKMEFRPTKGGLDTKYFKLNFENKKWEDSPDGITLAGRYESIKYNFKRVDISALKSNADFSPKLNEVVRIEKKSDTLFDIKKGVCSQTFNGTDSFAQWTTMPKYEVMQTSLADFMAVPVPTELTLLGMEQTQYCKITADIFKAHKEGASEKIWFVPYTVEWCVSDVPAFNTMKECESGISPSLTI